MIRATALLVLVSLLIAGCTSVQGDHFQPRPALSSAPDSGFGAASAAEILPEILEAAMREDRDGILMRIAVDRPFMGVLAEAFADRLISTHRAWRALQVFMPASAAAQFIESQEGDAEGLFLLLVTAMTRIDGRWFLDYTMPKPCSDLDAEEVRLAGGMTQLVNDTAAILYCDWIAQRVAAGERAPEALTISTFLESPPMPEAQARWETARAALRDIAMEARLRGMHWFDSLGLEEQSANRLRKFVGDRSAIGRMFTPSLPSRAVSVNQAP